MFSRRDKLDKQLKKVKSDGRRVQRELERDRNQLACNEAQLTAEIKRLAAQGDKQSAKMLAEQLVKNRQQVAKTYEMGARMNGMVSQQLRMKSNLQLARSAKASTDAMSLMNKQMEKSNILGVLKEYQKEIFKMSMSEDVMNDALDNIFKDTDDADEEDAVINQVLDELGIETRSKLAEAPTPASDFASGCTVSAQEIGDIDAQLERLRGI